MELIYRSDKSGFMYRVESPSGKTIYFGSSKGKIFKDSTPLCAYSYLNSYDHVLKEKAVKRLSTKRTDDDLPACMSRECREYYEVKYLWT